MALLLGACATAPPPPFVVQLRPTREEVNAGGELLLPMRVNDLRDVPDRARIGEVYAPLGGRPPPTGVPVLEAGMAVAMLLAPTQPTGRYIVVADASDVGRAVKDVLIHALLKTGQRSVDDGVVEAGVRAFWLRPSWTTTCDAGVELHVLGSDGKTRWETTLDVHVEKFEGWFSTEAFERVAGLALDQLADRAARSFASAAFRAAIAPSR